MQKPNTYQAIFNVDEAADYLRISRASMWRLLRHDIIPRIRLGGRTVVRRSDIDAHLERLATSS